MQVAFSAYDCVPAGHSNLIAVLKLILLLANFLAIDKKPCHLINSYHFHLNIMHIPYALMRFDRTCWNAS